ncbi:OmpA family protein [Psychromonas sp. psych-6C06]|uniref:OmpA family protein n=1 Tax=Psychromonas sp. psych-6C06 TaxID=2058089 RepID=UPI000C3210F1|nr:OmpA family protein [Psychromonas sp. psych-6C06]PKF63634.1 OmpA family protein [Psychromonas sp. psych-6C06]
MEKLFFLLIFLVVGCTPQVVDMTNGSTPQKFDLADPEGDGVINARDDCLQTETGWQVDNSGCHSETIYTVRHELVVNFETNSSIVSHNYFPDIEGLANFMKKYNEADVTIEGHTSIRGSKSYNDRLSQQRAEAIKEILVTQYAIDESRISAIGYGFSSLLLEGDDEYIHARNRRIVAEITSEEHIPNQKWTIYSVEQPSQE